MQILVVSDTHDESDVLRNLLEEYAAAVQLVIHLGDHDRDLLRFASITDLPLLTVAGNTDDESRSPRQRVCVFHERRLFITHGNVQNVAAGTEGIAREALEHEAHICLYGHTHKAVTFTQHGIFFMNPGSLTEPRDNGTPSYGVLTICEETGKIKGEIVRL
ncbi:MAG: YfcE family phosphodiesterase [Defluviitaleaceae bacterium]|nr:YfcE family phosphodiesterase [Defluviitaleaceae bacterium]MCL2273359.1 YfcE family phosphodiesterase [Defluviitaleaceae bacterium]